MKRFALFLIPLLLGAATFGSTPQETIERWLLPQTKTVDRINASGDFALARVSGVSIESFNLRSPILLKRFSFGWQVLATITAACELAELGVPDPTITLLAQGMSLPEDTQDCHGPGFVPDMGSITDVESIRQLMGMGVFHPYVVVVGDYAVAEWYGAGGGETFFKRSGKRWTRFTGGGAYSAQGLISGGMPRAAACKVIGIIGKPLGCGASR